MRQRDAGRRAARRWLAALRDSLKPPMMEVVGTSLRDALCPARGSGPGLAPLRTPTSTEALGEGFTAKGNTVAWNWYRNNQARTNKDGEPIRPGPLPLSDAFMNLTRLSRILTPAEAIRRRNAFIAASQWMQQVALSGGRGPIDRPFNARDARYPDARIDVVVRVGWAFIPQ